MPRMKEKYQTEVVPALMERFGYRNIMEVPRFEKIVLNIGVGEATQDPKALEAAVRDLEAISGQKPVITYAKKSVAAFKLRGRHGHWVQGDSAGRPHVRVPRSPNQHRLAPDS